MNATRFLAAAACATLAASLAAAQLGLRYNDTPSVPIGFYLLDRTDRSAKVGTYVVACPPQAPIFELARRRGYLGPGPCPGNISPLLKVVAAGPGDRVTIQHDAVWINGRRWPDSAPLPHDAQGRPLPLLRGLRTDLAADELLLLSEALPTGFDSRYFGPIRLGRVLGRATHMSLPFGLGL